jgi:hypothetical protein
MKVLRFLAKVSLSLSLVLIIQFLFFGLVSNPDAINESDSLVYHIPIAAHLARGSFVPPDVAQGIGFYPGAAEAVLAIFILLNLPLNTYGVLGFALLFYFSKKVAQAFGVSKDLAIIYAGTIVTLQSVLRWPLTQTVDILQNVFFLISLLLLKNPSPSIKYFVILGTFNGLLIGSKYSGFPYFVILILVFGKPILEKLNVRRLLAYLFPAFVFGLSWYVRNFLLTGNPLYPANLPFLVGNPDFYRSDSLTWSVLGNVIKNPPFLWEFLVAMISEYLGWAAVFLLPLAFFRKKKLDKDVSKLILSGLLVFIVFLTLLLAIPIVSNMRYIYPAMSTLILAAFLLLRRKYLEHLMAFSIIMAIFSLLNLSYHPKLLILAFIPVFYFVFINERFNLYNHI